MREKQLTAAVYPGCSTATSSPGSEQQACAQVQRLLRSAGDHNLFRRAGGRLVTARGRRREPPEAIAGRLTGALEECGGRFAQMSGDQPPPQRNGKCARSGPAFDRLIGLVEGGKRWIWPRRDPYSDRTIAGVVLPAPPRPHWVEHAVWKFRTRRTFRSRASSQSSLRKQLIVGRADRDARHAVRRGERAC